MKNFVSYSPKLTNRVIREMLDKNVKSVNDEIKEIKINIGIMQTNKNPHRVSNIFNDLFLLKLVGIYRKLMTQQI